MAIIVITVLKSGKNITRLESLEIRVINAQDMDELFNAEHLLNKLFPNYRFHISIE